MEGRNPPFGQCSRITHTGLPEQQPVFGVDAWQMRFEKIMCKCFMPPHFGWSAGAEMIFQSGL